MNTSSAASSPDLQAFVPKFVTALRGGYSFRLLRADGLASLVGGGALVPVILALTIEAGFSPDRGMISAGAALCVVALLGGSSFQIGAPTALLMVASSPVLTAYGESGLALATLMAGVLLIFAAITRWDTWLRYVPASLLTGVEVGVVVVIAWHQLASVGFNVPSRFDSPQDIAPAMVGHFPEVHAAPLGILFGTLLLLAAMRRVAPRWPVAVLAIAGASLAASLLHLPVETIGDRAARHIEDVNVYWADLTRSGLNGLIPTVFTLAFLIGVQSLRSARTADTHSGRWHRARGELLAQGIANVVVGTIGGLPVGGDPARTLENVKAGAQTPVSGILTGLLVLAAAILVRPCANDVPVASLSAILLMIAWDLGRWSRIRAQLGASRMDHALAAMVALLVVFVGVGAGVAAGVVLAALLVAHRQRRERVRVHASGDAAEIHMQSTPDARSNGPAAPPPTGVEVFEVRGSLVFENAHRLGCIAPYLERRLRALILDVQRVSCVDATGTEALEDLLHRCHRQRTMLVLAHLAPSVRTHLSECGLVGGNRLVVAHHVPHALRIVEALTGDAPFFANVSDEKK